jgi:hypothetical protein
MNRLVVVRAAGHERFMLLAATRRRTGFCRLGGVMAVAVPMGMLHHPADGLEIRVQYRRAPGEGAEDGDERADPQHD